MRTLILDTSVAVAWYLPESFSPQAREWQSQVLSGRIRLVVPLLHYWEFANVLRTYVRRAEIEPSLARDLYDVHLDAPLEMAEPDRDQVLKTALAFDATAYDAVYIALGAALDAPLLTAERSTTPWVVKLGKRIERVR